ncbi:IS21-like element helper ATPase IstB [Nitrolancea hollandica]|uniref:Putative Insertion sequence IS21 ATP-binding protein n=1 Tax=Nitrolancea hollandica Lb TaxID=1129897 RepID=I4EMJ5_9BACT|nr:IS21-like element helper ATPase IstB [Nitrolancea hollandica]CCF85908.1 putative Insertion sequence IS21 ATP-binding protein [Nitrolancea hollandica Lb]
MSADVMGAIIESYLKRLKLPAIAREYGALAREAELGNVGYLGYLQALLEQEVRQRDEHQLARRLKQARFPYDKRLEEFDFSTVRSIAKARVFELARGAFVRDHENLILIGASGLGKTHLLIGLGRALCFAGFSVLFRPAASLANELELAQKELRIERLLKQYRRYDLLLVDELGYLPVSKTAAQLLFGLFSDRYERASIGLTTNLDFAHWTEVFGDERMTAALLDRLTHRSHILALEGESYRFQQSLQRQAGT